VSAEPTVLLSVIMPAHQAESLLPITLGALVASEFPRAQWELIVVDDGSSDETAIVAGRYADTVIRLSGRPHGPAYARNRGFEVSRGEFVLFFDADVRVRPDTLRRFADALREDPTVGAIFGSYDLEPPAPGLVSQYRNLLHHFVHHQNAGEADTFWAGCGGVRRSVFDRAGMYDEWHFARPQIEDIELGHRIRDLGHRILLRPEIQVTHLKRWTLASVIRTDIRDRGIPWARLLAHRGSLVNSGALNLKWTEKLNTALVWLMVIGLVAAAWRRDPLLLAASLALAVPVIVLNVPLLAFFLRVRGLPFMLGVIPLHLQYYFLNGISAVTGVLLHETLGAPTPDPTIDEFAEDGLQKWPPIPSKARPSSWGSSPRGQ
jgi:glycosyltransferase involved in cell wall biosynthesis